MFSCSFIEAAPLRRATPAARTTLNQRIIDWAMVAYDYCAMLRGDPHKMALDSMLTALRNT